MRSAIVALLLLLIGAAPLAAPSPDVHAAPQEIKALPQDQIDDLRAGRGMGLAKAAELNGYPGPMHVLELAVDLDLTPAQRAASEAILSKMRAAAIALGSQILAGEQALDRAFADRTVDSSAVRNLTAEIAALHGRLRAVHLGAHLEQHGLLTRAQADRYMMLRGYAGDASHHHHK